MEAKSNEISAIPELLPLLDLTGCVVTLDAIGTQTAIAAQIVNTNADYILPVKENQATLYEDMQLLFEGVEGENYRDVPYDTYKQVSEGYNRREIRQRWVVSEAKYRADVRRGAEWANLSSLVKMLTVRITPQKIEITIRYFISSWWASAQAFLNRIREHWQIENGLHWVLDIAFRDDECRIRKDHAPQNMATLRHMAINLLKQEQSVRVGIAAKRKMCGWDDAYLLKVLCP